MKQLKEAEGPICFIENMKYASNWSKLNTDAEVAK